MKNKPKKKHTELSGAAKEKELLSFWLGRMEYPESGPEAEARNKCIEFWNNATLKLAKPAGTVIMISTVALDDEIGDEFRNMWNAGELPAQAWNRSLYFCPSKEQTSWIPMGTIKDKSEIDEYGNKKENDV